MLRLVEVVAVEPIWDGTTDGGRDDDWDEPHATNISFCFDWPIMLEFQICILTMACEL